MNEEIELKPCPFCGNKKFSIEDAYLGFVICNTCKAYGPDGNNATEAIQKWNERANA